MYCKKCGNVLKEGAKFCNKCGQAIAPAAPPKLGENTSPATVCTQCGSPVKTGSKFCNKCGQAVASYASPEPGDDTMRTATPVVSPPPTPAMPQASPVTPPQPSRVTSRQSTPRPKKKNWAGLHVLLCVGVLIVVLLAVYLAVYFSPKETESVAKPVETGNTNTTAGPVETEDTNTTAEPVETEDTNTMPAANVSEWLYGVTWYDDYYGLKKIRFDADGSFSGEDIRSREEGTFTVNGNEIILKGMFYEKGQDYSSDYNSTLTIENNSLKGYTKTNLIEAERAVNSCYATTKTYFYDAPGSSRTGRYILKGDIVMITAIQDGYGYGVYTFVTGRKTEGWLAMSDFKLNTVVGVWMDFENMAYFLKADGTWLGWSLSNGTYGFDGNTVVIKNKGDTTSEGDAYALKNGNRLTDEYGEFSRVTP